MTDSANKRETFLFKIGKTTDALEGFLSSHTITRTDILFFKVQIDSGLYLVASSTKESMSKLFKSLFHESLLTVKKVEASVVTKLKNCYKYQVQSFPASVDSSSVLSFYNSAFAEATVYNCEFAQDKDEESPVVVFDEWPIISNRLSRGSGVETLCSQTTSLRYSADNSDTLVESLAKVFSFISNAMLIGKSLGYKDVVIRRSVDGIYDDANIDTFIQEEPTILQLIVSEKSPSGRSAKYSWIPYNLKNSECKIIGNVFLVLGKLNFENSGASTFSSILELSNPETIIPFPDNIPRRDNALELQKQLSAIGTDETIRNFSEIATSSNAAKARLEISKLEAHKKTLIADLVKTINSINEQHKVLQIYSEKTKNGKSNVEAVLNEIASWSNVENVFLKNNVIVIMTKSLICRPEGKQTTHEIGKMKISLDFNEKRVIWKNRTRRVHGYSYRQNHPHVWSDGRACEGNITSALSTCFQTADILGLAVLAITFIESANTADPAGGRYARWPKVINTEE